MAKNWTVAHVMKTLENCAGPQSEEDIINRVDIARRFPLLATASREDIISALFCLTARKMESYLQKFYAGDLPEVLEDEPEEKPRKKGTGKRGRPPKVVKPVDEDEDDEDEDEEEEEPKPVRKGKKGRPRKNPVPVDEDEEDEDDEDEPAPKTKGKKGRPKKEVEPDADDEDEDAELTDEDIDAMFDDDDDEEDGF